MKVASEHSMDWFKEQSSPETHPIFALRSWGFEGSISPETNPLNLCFLASTNIVKFSVTGSNLWARLNLSDAICWNMTHEIIIVN
jgi:hypothetical protein